MALVLIFISEKKLQSGCFSHLIIPDQYGIPRPQADLRQHLPNGPRGCSSGFCQGSGDYPHPDPASAARRNALLTAWVAKPARA